MIAIRESDGVLSFMVRVQPRASRNEIATFSCAESAGQRLSL